MGATGLEPVASFSQSTSSKALTKRRSKALAQSLACEPKKALPVPVPFPDGKTPLVDGVAKPFCDGVTNLRDQKKGPPADSLDPALARIVNAWPDLPEAIRRAMLALVGTSASRS
jgi:hypothetical protein